MEVEPTAEDRTGEQDESYEPFVKFITESWDVSVLSALSV